MKSIALILTFLVLSMVTIPAISSFNDNDEEKHACCVADQDSENSSKDDCCEKGCNPFINCCGMMGFIPSNPLFFQDSKATSFEKVSDHYLDPKSDCSLEIWQPPKV